MKTEEEKQLQLKTFAQAREDINNLEQENENLSQQIAENNIVIQRLKDFIMYNGQTGE